MTHYDAMTEARTAEENAFERVNRQSAIAQINEFSKDAAFYLSQDDLETAHQYRVWAFEMAAEHGISRNDVSSAIYREEMRQHAWEQIAYA